MLKLREREREKKDSPRTDVISLSENGIIYMVQNMPSEETSGSQHVDKPNKTLTTQASKRFNPLPTSLLALFMLCSGVCVSSEGCIETLQPLSMTDLF